MNVDSTAAMHPHPQTLPTPPVSASVKGRIRADPVHSFFLYLSSIQKQGF